MIQYIYAGDLNTLQRNRIKLLYALRRASENGNFDIVKHLLDLGMKFTQGELNSYALGSEGVHCTDRLPCEAHHYTKFSKKNQRLGTPYRPAVPGIAQQ